MDEGASEQVSALVKKCVSLSERDREREHCGWLGKNNKDSHEVGGWSESVIE